MNARGWAQDVSERLRIETGICGDAQESGFMNATLQSTANDPDLEFSIAVHVEIPVGISTEEKLARFLGGIFGQIVNDHPEIHVEIQLGPAGDGEEDDDEEATTESREERSYIYRAIE